MGEEYPKDKIRKRKIRIFDKQIYLDDLVGTPQELTTEMEMPSDIEYVVFHLSIPEVELLVLRFMGYTSKEIMKQLGFRKAYMLYQLSSRLKKNAGRLVNMR